MDYIYIYIVGLLSAASLMLAWFHSGLPEHIIGTFRLIGVARNNHEFWEALATNWQDALNIYYPNLLSELLTCTVCLAFHVSFWVGLVSYILTDVPLYYPIITACSWPILINLILLKFRHE